eukprot:6203422-Pleurochrysis_carterae.AAC.3
MPSRGRERSQGKIALSEVPAISNTANGVLLRRGGSFSAAASAALEPSGTPAVVKSRRGIPHAWRRSEHAWRRIALARCVR